MNYYGAISNDLHLNSKNVTLSSVIRRNAYITSETITTNSDFLLYGSLEADSHEFNFSGQIDGDAKINSKKINFIDDTDGNKIECLISGDLNYSSKEELQAKSIGKTILSLYFLIIFKQNSSKSSSYLLFPIEQPRDFKNVSDKPPAIKT